MNEDGLREFVAEAEELIDAIAQNLMELDESEDIESPNPEAINSIFRSAHTLKGMSGMVGLSTVADLSHKLEDLLDGLRMGRVTPSHDIFDILFKGVDILRILVGQISQGEEENVDIAPIVKQIAAVMLPGDSVEEDDALKAAGIDPEIIKVLTEYETHRLRTNIKNKLTLYEIKTEYSLETFDVDLSATIEMLGKKGELIATLPDANISGDVMRMVFNLVYASKSSIDDLYEVAKDRVVDITEIKYVAEGGQAQGTTEQVSSPKENTAAPDALAAEQQSIKSLSTTLRVEIVNLDMLLNLVGELVLAKAIISGITKDLLQEQGLTDTLIELQKSTLALDRRVAELQEGLIAIRMVPVAQIFDRLTRIVRKTSKSLNKGVNLHISGEDTKLDKSMIEDIADPMMHLIRNSIDHGIESAEVRKERGKDPIGTIKLSASQRGSSVVVEVEDDGGGIDIQKIRVKAVEQGLLDESGEYSDREITNQLFQPGFSTASSVTEVSGRGVGLDVVARNVAKLGGRVDIESEFGKWSRFTISLPITLVIIKALIVSTAAEIFALPLNAVSESLIINPSEIRTIETREVIRLRDQTLPLVYLDDIFCLPNRIRMEKENKYVVVVGIAEKRVGIVVDSIAGQQEIVIKSTGEILENVPGIAGATELGNRRTILVLDVAGLIEEATL